MTITLEALETRRKQHTVLQLAILKGWVTHELPLMTNGDYAARLSWLQSVMDVPYTEFDDLDNHGLFYWTHAPITLAEQGTQSGMILAFRRKEDLALYLLKWA